MAAQTIAYQRGMSYADFLAMMAQRRSGAAQPVPEPEPGDVCPHPFERLVVNIRARKAPGGVRVIVETTCGDCGADLGAVMRGFRVAPQVVER